MNSVRFVTALLISLTTGMIVFLSGCTTTPALSDIQKYQAEKQGLIISGTTVTGVKSTEITSCVSPENITAVGEGAFWGCKDLRQVKLPSTLKHIGDHAFHDCYELQEIILPENLETIGEVAFSG